MAEATLKIVNSRGLHARAAAKLVHLASTFRSRITVTHGDEEADGKSILSLMILGAGQGAELQVRAEGPDEKEAVEQIGALIGGGFDEED